MRLNVTRRFKRAVRGLLSVITSDILVILLSMMGILVIAVSLWFRISRIEFIVVLVIVFSIITLEGINTILERVIDLVEPRYKEMVAEIKDALAGFVLLSIFGSAVIGLIIFWPYIVEKFY